MHRDSDNLHIGALGQLASPKAGPDNPIDDNAREPSPKAPVDPRGLPVVKKPEIDPGTGGAGKRKPIPRMGQAQIQPPGVGFVEAASSHSRATPSSCRSNPSRVGFVEVAFSTHPEFIDFEVSL